MTTEPARAIVYTRVSTTTQEDNTSLETQRRNCLEYAARNGLEVVVIVKRKVDQVAHGNVDRPSGGVVRA
jgi:DNA invertase Pin-like site-specific DNA recombinase